MKKRLERIHAVADNLFVRESENHRWVFLSTEDEQPLFALRVEELPALVVVLEQIALHRFPPLGGGPPPSPGE